MVWSNLAWQCNEDISLIKQVSFLLGHTIYTCISVVWKQYKTKEFISFGPEKRVHYNQVFCYISLRSLYRVSTVHTSLVYKYIMRVTAQSYTRIHVETFRIGVLHPLRKNFIKLYFGYYLRVCFLMQNLWISYDTDSIIE